MNKRIISKRLLILLVFCSCNSNDSKTQRIQDIDRLTDNHSAVANRVIVDTTVANNDTLYTQYHYDNSAKLTLISIEETATINKYLSYIDNDSLIKITINRRDPNHSSDEAASYYLIKDSVFHKVETRGKLGDLNKFILDQKRNIKYFNDSLSQKIR